MAANHLLRGILESSKMVPTVAGKLPLAVPALEQGGDEVLGTRAPRDPVGAGDAALWADRALGPATFNEDFPAFLSSELQDVNQGAVGKIEHGHLPAVNLLP